MKRRYKSKNLNAEESDSPQGDEKLKKDGDESADPSSQGETESHDEFLDSPEPVIPSVLQNFSNYSSSSMFQPQLCSSELSSVVSLPPTFGFKRAPPSQLNQRSSLQVSGEHGSSSFKSRESTSTVQLKRPRVLQSSTSADHSWSPSKDSTSVSSATRRIVPWGSPDCFSPSSEAKSEQMFNFISPHHQFSFTSAEQKKEEPVRAAGSSQLDEWASERRMSSSLKFPPRSFSLDEGSVSSVRNFGTRHYSQESGSVCSESSWTQSTDPSVIGLWFPESRREETQQHAVIERLRAKIEYFRRSSPLLRDCLIEYYSSLIKSLEPRSVSLHHWNPSQDSNPSTLPIVQTGSTSPSPAPSDVIESGPFRTNSAVSDQTTTSSSDTKHKHTSSFFSGHGLSLPETSDSTQVYSSQPTLTRWLSTLYVPSPSLPPTGLIYPPISPSSSQSSISSFTVSGCHSILDEDTEEDPEAQSLHEILEPATRYGVFSPLEADSHLQSSTTDSSERKKVSRSSSFPSSPKTSANSKSLKRAASLPDMKLKSSFKEFSPDCTDEFDGETYRFQCSCPGLYQCRETGLVFDMKEGGQVLYRILTWNRRQLSPHHKKPAGPLFDIKCLKEGSMSQLHLPHCEIFSTSSGCGFLSVAHVKDDGIEFIRPEKITETHVIIKVTGFSGFGNVKDEDFPSVPIRVLVLLFYKPPLDHKLKYIISMLLLPKNVVLKSVLHFRKKVCQNEMYIETPQYCKLCPDQLYSLTTRPGGDSVRVQPSNAEFDEDHNENYVPTFQVIYETMMDDIDLFLKDSSSTSVWESLVCLPPSRPTRPDLSSNQQLKDICSSFIDRISGPVLQSLLDKLLEKHVINDGERESAEEKRNRGNRARVVLDMVRRKGDAASSKMMEILCELDPFLCKDLGLI